MSGPSSCRRCQGALPAPDGDGNVVCPSCGMFHHVGDDVPPPPPPPPSGPFGAGAPGQGQAARAAASRPSGGRRRRGPGIGCGVALLVTGVIAAAIVAIVVAATRSVDLGGDGPDLAVTLTTGDGEVVTDAEGRPGDIVGLVNRVGAGDRVVARVSPGGDVRWEATVVPSNVYSAQFRVTDDLVLAGLGRQVVALDARTGATRWEATVSDEIDPRCRECLSVLDGQLVVFSRDAYLTVLGLDDGASTWTRRLDSAQGRVHVVDGRLLVADEPADGSSPAALVETDVATGDEVGRIAPSCPDPAWGDEPGHTIDMEVDAEVVPVPGTADVVVLFGFGSTCIQRWSLDDRAVRWSQAPEAISSFFDPTFTADGIDLVMSDSSVLVHVSLSEGTTTALALPQDSGPSPVLALAGGRLVTAVQSNRGTARWTLLALDLRSKEVLWERELPDGAEPFDLSPDRSSDTVFEGETRFLLTARGDDEVAVVTMASPGARLTVETVDAATGRGTAAGRDTFALRSSTSTSPSVRIEAVTGGRLVFSSESIPQVLDLATGKVVSSWAG